MKKLLIAAAMLAISFTGISAQDAAPEQKAEKTPIPADASMLQVAGRLVKYGYDKGEALPLIQAVEIFQSVGGNQYSGTKESEGTAATDDTKEASKVSYDINQLIADATELADGNANLLALIDGLKNSQSRGATSNYDVHTDIVKAHDTDIYKIRFRGGEEAIVVVSGDGDTDLDLYVYDANGNLVDSDTDYTDDCVAVWTPRWTGTFTIKIVNRGNVYNRYRLAVN